MGSFAPPPGTADIFEAEAGNWRALESAARKIFSRYGYGELRTPVFEYTEVFQKGLGNETEVVRKEMYTFEDRGGRSLTLRPEGTAGVMRALSNTDVMNGVEQRVYYIGPMFRGERPAAGRRRQFHQIGVENVGRCAPLLDAECIAMLAAFLRSIGLDGFTIDINTRGSIADRAPAEAELRRFFADKLDCMCEDCRTRYERNIWRMLDCKQEKCREIIAGVPDVVSFFSPASQEYFNSVRKALDMLKVPYRINPNLVRGLDYYVHTVFEVTHPALGEQTAIAGGGRYELYLPGETRPLPGVGFASGVERLLLCREAAGIAEKSEMTPDVYMIGLGKDAVVANLALAEKWRSLGLSVALELEERSFKAQMRAANKSAAPFAVIRGESEMAGNCVVVKNMSDGSQETLSLDQLNAFVQDKLKK